MIRRALGTTLAGLVALTGPLASGAVAVTAAPALTLSTTSVRPGTAFTVTPAAGNGCPAGSGLQTVELFFTDHAGERHSIGWAETADDGSWAGATAQLPVAGLDQQGAWSSAPVALGAGTVSAVCFSGDEPADDSVDDPGDDGAGSEEGEDEPGDDGAGAEGDDPGDDGFEDGSDEDGFEGSSTGDAPAGEETEDAPTLTYPGTGLSVVGAASALTLSAATLTPGDSVTVTPGEGCVTGPGEVTVAVVDLSGDEEPAGGLPSRSVTTSATGTWPAVTLALPAGTATGDYAVTATCSISDAVTSSYDAEPFALGTVRIGPATCGAKAAFAPLTGTYQGTLAGRSRLTLPARFALDGDGPWTVKLHSATTGQLLASRTVACAKLRYHLDVLRTRLSDANKPQARVCNTGRSPLVAVLQVLKGKKYQTVDKETVNPGACTWLQGAKLARNTKVKAQVHTDAPGRSSDGVVTSFTVKRGKR